MAKRRRGNPINRAKLAPVQFTRALTLRRIAQYVGSDVPLLWEIKKGQQGVLKGRAPGAPWLKSVEIQFLDMKICVEVDPRHLELIT